MSASARQGRSRGANRRRAGSGPVALRARAPFMSPPAPVVFRPEAGFVKPPDTELRASNNLDYRQVSRVNSLGFLDREPPSPERAAASCHLTILGDSFIEAREVPITSKVQVRLEELAAAERPDLDLTTSAFGLRDTRQVQQLAFFDAYARPLEPKAVVLALVLNDLRNNSSLLRGIRHGWDPERLPQTSARRGPDGAFSLLPPDAGYAESALDPDAAALPAETPAPPLVLLRRAVRCAYLYRWLRAKRGALFRYDAARSTPSCSAATRRRAPGTCSGGSRSRSWRRWWRRRSTRRPSRCASSGGAPTRPAR